MPTLPPRTADNDVGRVPFFSSELAVGRRLARPDLLLHGFACHRERLLATASSLLRLAHASSSLDVATRLLPPQGCVRRLLPEELLLIAAYAILLTFLPELACSSSPSSRAPPPRRPLEPPPPSFDCRSSSVSSPSLLRLDRPLCALRDMPVPPLPLSSPWLLSSELRCC